MKRIFILAMLLLGIASVLVLGVTETHRNMGPRMEEAPNQAYKK